MNNLEVKKLIKDSKGEIIGYELNTGSIIDNEQAIYMVKLGELNNVKISQGQGEKNKIQGIDFDINSLPILK